jgi:hypothetical protein
MNKVEFVAVLSIKKGGFQSLEKDNIGWQRAGVLRGKRVDVEPRKNTPPGISRRR